jgi:alkylation response protein AidB-like acyl-CoA dehydrogenase|eukprot:TRINITY_DN16459_c0_g1_i1.p1 TRINITY_DN16459_c0_g1~~TRINITY_DN16459_c0_g1_i1.p1  ORF type:complete len:479 (+),score=98.33 TRINITY_DN16459_c0_g1_i1:80-1516(+)
MVNGRAEQLAAWCKAVGDKLTKSYLDITFEESSNQLRELLKTGILKLTDLRDDPEWFFEAHRIIAENTEVLGAGFWTRFTVQYNLFAGTVLAVGNPSQVQQLNDVQRAGELGAFGLTEKFAGVSSGMVVETIAEFDNNSREFIIRTPNDGAKKNWISQGFCADKCVVVADLHISGKSHGPHAFLMDFRVARDGGRELVKGISLADMGRKTVCNDLDNAWISFDSVRIPESALLDRFGGIDEQGVYSPKQKGLSSMEQIGQRLFTGRVAVAQAALVCGRGLFAKTREYTDKKLCWAPNGLRPPLSMLPQLGSLFAEAEEAFSYGDRYAKLCEEKLNACLREDRIPPKDLMDAIAVAKIRAVETVVQLCFRLKQTVGSRALMANSGFESLDSMQVAKFAEGESFVLMMKLARDRVKQKNLSNVKKEEEAIVAELGKSSPAQWAAKADQVYHLAELVMDRTMEELMGSSMPRGIARPWAKL